MNLNKNQNRRDFLEGSIKEAMTSVFGIAGMFIGENKMVSSFENECPDNIACTDCFKMGICKMAAAEKTRLEVKRNGGSAKISKGAYHDGEK